MKELSEDFLRMCYNRTQDRPGTFAQYKERFYNKKQVMPLKIAFDLGGVLSKHACLRQLYLSLSQVEEIRLFVISDMHNVEKIKNMLQMNDLPTCNVYSANYEKHGEKCKQVLCEELGIDMILDDFIGYVAQGKQVRLLVMPDPDEPYYSDDWKTDGSEGNFGRRRKPLDKP